ncbi:3027_t:CDS:2, partial [Acaulospora colombiana]
GFFRLPLRVELTGIRDLPAIRTLSRERQIDTEMRTSPLIRDHLKWDFSSLYNKRTTETMGGMKHVILNRVIVPFNSSAKAPEELHDIELQVPTKSSLADEKHLLSTDQINQQAIGGSNGSGTELSALVAFPGFCTPESNLQFTVLKILVYVVCNLLIGNAQELSINFAPE